MQKYYAYVNKISKSVMLKLYYQQQQVTVNINLAVILAVHQQVQV